MIEILSGGGLNTVQDLGRYGYRKIGVTVAGAMDKLALAAGNLMLGNPPGSAGIEVTIFPFRVRFLAGTRIALTGADGNARLDGEPVLPWWSLQVRKGQVLELPVARSGSRAYLTARGGIDVPVVMNSRSTDLKVKFGGFEGRSLRKGDRLALLAADGDRAGSAGGYGVEPPQLALGFQARSAGEALAIRVVPAAEYELFTKAAQRQFWAGPWQITPNSNRQGYRFAGTPLLTQGLPELLSRGMVPGTLQVPPSGLPIVQMSDANPSGGYPNIGTVIEADLWRLAQAGLGDSVQFVRASVPEAVAALKAERDWLRRVEAAVATLRERRPDLERRERDSRTARA